MQGRHRFRRGRRGSTRPGSFNRREGRDSAFPSICRSSSNSSERGKQGDGSWSHRTGEPQPSAGGPLRSPQDLAPLTRAFQPAPGCPGFFGPVPQPVSMERRLVHEPRKNCQRPESPDDRGIFSAKCAKITSKPAAPGPFKTPVGACPRVNISRRNNLPSHLHKCLFGIQYRIGKCSIFPRLRGVLGPRQGD